jgi:hypothetical protein
MGCSGIPNSFVPERRDGEMKRDKERKREAESKRKKEIEEENRRKIEGK